MFRESRENGKDFFLVQGLVVLRHDYGKGGFLPCMAAILGRCAALLEAIGLVAGLGDVAIMCQSIQHRRGQLGVNEHATPLGEAAVMKQRQPAMSKWIFPHDFNVQISTGIAP